MASSEIVVLVTSVWEPGLKSDM